jgi:hypothetical protein
VRRRRRLSRREFLAYHEAGHVVVGWLRGTPVRLAAIPPRRPHVRYVPGAPDDLSVVLAGLGAETLLAGYSRWRGVSADGVRAERLVANWGLDWRTMRRAARRLVCRELRDHWGAVEAVAEALLLRTTLGHAALMTLCVDLGYIEYLHPGLLARQQERDRAAARLRLARAERAVDRLWSLAASLKLDRCLIEHEALREGTGR